MFQETSGTSNHSVVCCVGGSNSSRSRQTKRDRRERNRDRDRGRSPSSGRGGRAGHFYRRDGLDTRQKLGWKTAHTVGQLPSLAVVSGIVINTAELGKSKGGSHEASSSSLSSSSSFSLGSSEKSGERERMKERGGGKVEGEEAM